MPAAAEAALWKQRALAAREFSPRPIVRPPVHRPGTAWANRRFQLDHHLDPRQMLDGLSLMVASLCAASEPERPSGRDGRLQRATGAPG
jgi:hypothetical protein